MLGTRLVGSRDNLGGTVVQILNAPNIDKLILQQKSLQEVAQGQM